MRTALSFAIILALGASPVLAKTAYCTNPTTHKRISCTVAAKPIHAKTAIAAPAAAKPAKTSLFAKRPGLFAKKPAAAMAATPVARPTAMVRRSGATTAHKGKKCGNSYIATNRVCHKG